MEIERWTQRTAEGTNGTDNAGGGGERGGCNSKAARVGGTSYISINSTRGVYPTQNWLLLVAKAECGSPAFDSKCPRTRINLRLLWLLPGICN